MIQQRIQLHEDLSIHVNYTKGDKPAILFLHFSGGTSEMWSGVLPLFLEEYEVIAPDLRGHGRSDRPETGYHIDDMAQDMFLLLRKLGIAQCHVVGSSLGAEVGLSLAADHPEMVISLVCEGALYNEFGEYGLFVGTEEEAEREKARVIAELPKRQVPVYDTPTEYLAESRRSFEELGLWNEYFFAFAESTMVQTEEGKFTSHYENRVRTEYISKYMDVKFDSYYKKVQCPILFLPSEEDWGNERIQSSMHVFASIVKVSEIHRIPQAVHAYVWMQMPFVISGTVNTFLKGVKSGMEVG
ncbi:alpha/beta fold hydrolase [Paenibacillus sp. sgz500958]|uniref:alpha/beta fold hydrolase n=1 Tax=Paenibacillus sp. sgz500958 TaxID=3242475 RepID=UPI0036D3937A